MLIRCDSHTGVLSGCSPDLVDATTLIVISTVAQTIVITVTLVVFILQFRSQERAIRESSYQGLMGRYNSFISMLVEKPELTKLVMDNMPSSAERADVASKEDAAVFAHLLVAYGIIEEAYSLYSKKWIDEENWSHWAAWLRILSGHPLFLQMHSATAGTFDKNFQEFVSKEILKERRQK